MAVRTIPAMVEYGRLVARLAPRAWLINFANPVSIITQAVHQETDARLIGICDTPMEMFEDAAHASACRPRVCAYDYFGLNHLGWLRDVLFEGEAAAASHSGTMPEACMSAYRSPLFEPERLRAMKLLPTEYLYYYYRPDVALANMQRAGSSRGAAVSALTDDSLPGSEPRRPPIRWRATNAISPIATAATCSSRPASSTPRIKPDWAELSGYDRIALMTMRAIVHNQGAIIPLDVANGGTLPFLDDDDIVEVPCRVDDDGPRAAVVAPIPDHPRDLIDAGEDLRARDGARRADRRTQAISRRARAQSARRVRATSRATGRRLL